MSIPGALQRIVILMANPPWIQAAGVRFRIQPTIVWTRVAVGDEVLAKVG